jgi:hypothetical protein
MPMSKRLKALELEIDTLRKHFLPDHFDPIGVYPNSIRVQAYTRAFVVLSHAEIEGYLEGWAKEIARASEKIWSSSGRVTTPLAFLLSTLAERIAVPTALGSGGKDSPQMFAENSKKVFETYYTRIKNNHGIKEANVLALFAPLGVPATALGSTLLPNLDNFGKLRGTHAHESAKAVQSVLDPETEYKRVTELIKDLSVLGQWCEQQTPYPLKETTG